MSDEPTPMIIETKDGDLSAWLCVCGSVVAVGYNGHFQTCPTAIVERKAEAEAEETVTPNDDDE